MYKPVELPMQEDAMCQLRALNARFIHNFVTNDVKCHDAITHERFICMRLGGAREAKPAYLARWATGFDPAVIVYWDYRDERITIFDNVALVRATNKHTIRKDGTEITGMTAYTDTYIHENGEWKCIQAQFTPVAPEHFPGDETIVRKYIKGELQTK
jgi:ketosteroid isomerase-like protein